MSTPVPSERELAIVAKFDKDPRVAAGSEMRLARLAEQAIREREDALRSEMVEAAAKGVYASRFFPNYWPSDSERARIEIYVDAVLAVLRGNRT